MTSTGKKNKKEDEREGKLHGCVVRKLVVFSFPQDEGGGTDGDDVAFANDGTVVVVQDFALEKRSGVGGSVTKDEAEVAGRRAVHRDDAVGRVHARIDRFDGCVGFGAFDPSSHDVLSFVKRNGLFEMKNIFHHHQMTDSRRLGRRGCGTLGRAGGQAEFELFVASGTFKHKDTSRFVSCFIKKNCLVTFGTANSFHGQ